MAKRRRLTTILVAAAFLLLGYTAGAQIAEKAGEKFKARLTPVPMDLTMASTVAGSGSLTATLTGSKLSIAGTFEGLRSRATAARLHRAPKGLRGPAVVDLTVTKATSGAVSGSLDPTSAQIEDLKNGRLYVQIYSEGAPDGNLRGWLLR